MAPNNLNDLTISQDAMILRLLALFQDLAAHISDPDTTVLDETWEIAKDKMTRLEAIFEQVIDATPDAQKAATSALHEDLHRRIPARCWSRTSRYI